MNSAVVSNTVSLRLRGSDQDAFEMLAVLSELQTTACMRHISEYVLGKHRGPYCEGYELQAEHGQL